MELILRKMRLQAVIACYRLKFLKKYKAIKVITCFLVLLPMLAYAHSSDIPFADWMRSLTRPDNEPLPCCGPADQVYVDLYWENSDGSFTGVVDEKRIDIPKDKVIWDKPNPTGRGVLFYIPEKNQQGGDFEIIFCFVPALGT